MCIYMYRKSDQETEREERWRMKAKERERIVHEEAFFVLRWNVLLLQAQRQ